MKNSRYSRFANRNSYGVDIVRQIVNVCIFDPVHNLFVSAKIRFLTDKIEKGTRMATEGPINCFLESSKASLLVICSFSA